MLNVKSNLYHGPHLLQWMLWCSMSPSSGLGPDFLCCCCHWLQKLPSFRESHFTQDCVLSEGNPSSIRYGLAFLYSLTIPAPQLLTELLTLLEFNSSLHTSTSYTPQHVLYLRSTPQ